MQITSKPRAINKVSKYRTPTKCKKMHALATIVSPCLRTSSSRPALSASLTLSLNPTHRKVKSETVSSTSCCRSLPRYDC